MRTFLTIVYRSDAGQIATAEMISDLPQTIQLFSTAV
jgi:hypothetical protein